MMSKPSEPSTCCYMLDMDMSSCPSIELSYPSVDSIEPSVDSIELSYPATLPLSASTGKIVLPIGVAGSFSEGGQPFCPAKIQSFPATIFSCQGGPSSSILSCQVTVLSCSTKLLCQLANMAGEWLKNRQK